MTGSNVGRAGSLDLFKLHGMSTTTVGSISTPNTELSRLLLHFNLDPLRTLISQGKIIPSNSSFSCTLKLFDVYGGQPTPSNFTLYVCPLSQSFDEGHGQDIVFYSDLSVCNFVTASYDSIVGSSVWFASGANEGGYSGQPSIDYITSSAGTTLTSTQTFIEGDEDLDVDVTPAVLGILGSTVPDCGFRVSYNRSHETDTYSYFVKRFASRHAYDASKHPQLIVTYDDSLMSDQECLRADSAGTILLYNFSNNRLSNLVSGSTILSSSNCVILKMTTEISGGLSTNSFSGSYVSTGIYSASAYFSSTDSVVKRKLEQSGSISYTQIWTSIDGSTAFFTGSNITLNPPLRSNDRFTHSKYSITTMGILHDHRSTDVVRTRFHIADVGNQFVKLVKYPVEAPGLVIHDVHYSIRDASTDAIIIPFDKTHNSTRLSSDSQGMYTDIDMSNLTPGRAYCIDVLITGDNDELIQAVSPIFRISETV